MKTNTPLLIGVPSKDRLVELTLCIQSIFTQTYTEWDLLIINDGQQNSLDNTTLQGLLNVIRESGHKASIIRGDCKGPAQAGQKILDNSIGYDFIFRPDDDISCDQFVLENMMSVIDSDPNIAAVGPVYINPYKLLSEQICPDIPMSEKEKACEIYWVGNDLYLNGWIQNVIHKNLDPIKTQHLNSGFLYRREVGEKIGYDMDLSKVSHREESSFSYKMFLKSHKLFIVPSAICFHFHPSSGGIRETLGDIHRKELWDHDEKLFLERMKKWLPMDPNINKEKFVSVVVLTHGEKHEGLRKLVDGITTYTTHPYELIVVNNDISEESKKDIKLFADEFNDRVPKLKILELEEEKSVGEARNLGVKMASSEKYICFIDDDAIILGRYNQTTDWLDFMYNLFTNEPDIGAISPIYTYFEPLQCHCVSVACMFTSKRVWNIVGGFDPVFGSKARGTFGYEDTDWSYRCESAGFKLRGVEINNFPFYHENTTGKKKPEWVVKGLEKSYPLFLSKYKDEPINKFCRTNYPFTPRQIELPGTKLNLGCYYMYIDQFVNVDAQELVNPDLLCDIRDIKKYYGRNSVSVILISQCLEHISEDDARKLVIDFYEMLSPGGEVIIEVPDCDDIEERLKSGNLSQHDYDVFTKGEPNMPYQKHLSTFTTQKIEEILRAAGFSQIRKMPIDMTSTQFEAIRIDARK